MYICVYIYIYACILCMYVYIYIYIAQSCWILPGVCCRPPGDPLGDRPECMRRRLSW